MGDAPTPPQDIGAPRQQSRCGDGIDQELIDAMAVEAETELGQDQRGERDLGGRIHLADEERLHLQALGQGLIENGAADDEHVAEDDQNHQPLRHFLDIAHADIDACQQRLVGERVEIGAQQGSAAQDPRQIAVEGVRHPRGDEEPEGGREVIGHDQPDGRRHGQKPRQADEIRQRLEEEARLPSAQGWVPPARLSVVCPSAVS